MRYISRDDVDALKLGIADIETALVEAFLASRNGAIVGKPKSNILRSDGIFLVGALASWAERGHGVFHSIMGTTPDKVPPGAPHYTTLQVLSDYHAGTPLAIVDGSFTSTMLPVGVTALTARRLARADSRVIAMIAAGLQARVNLAALVDLFPLREVRIVSRTEQSARTFAAEVELRGLRAVVTHDAETAVRGADIIVSSVPGAPGMSPFLDPAWVSAGAYVSAVDVGRSWKPGFERFERTVVDDRVQAEVMHREGRLAWAGPFDTEIPELLAGARPGRERATDRIAFIHPGNIVGILAFTELIYRKAASRGLGQVLGQALGERPNHHAAV